MVWKGREPNLPPYRRTHKYKYVYEYIQCTLCALKILVVKKYCNIFDIFMLTFCGFVLVNCRHSIVDKYILKYQSKNEEDIEGTAGIHPPNKTSKSLQQLFISAYTSNKINHCTETWEIKIQTFLYWTINLFAKNR